MDDIYRFWRDESLKAWTQFLTPIIESNAFVQVLGLMTEPLLTAQKNVRKTTVLVLDMLDMPSRQNLADLSYRVHLAEKHSLESEEQVEEAQATHQRLEARLNAALTALDDSLRTAQHLQDRLEAANQP